ncbi:hypothetical protein BDB01DRAFT_835959 [Pilobolus umbonatus]|nr:hypothetical protein BDB01DRAFT_835959 [Pilobolus umbonatus]
MLDCIHCLPNPLLFADTFGIFRCSVCNQGPETFERKGLSWITIVHLVIYNLIKKAQIDDAKKPKKDRREHYYFRWKEDVCAFIDRYWDYFIPDKQRSLTWNNTIASVLSTHSNIFLSGFEKFHQSAWWTLHKLEPPTKEKKKAAVSKPKLKRPLKRARQEKSTTKPKKPKKARMEREESLEIDMSELSSLSELSSDEKFLLDDDLSSSHKDNAKRIPAHTNNQVESTYTLAGTHTDDKIEDTHTDDKVDDIHADDKLEAIDTDGGIMRTTINNGIRDTYSESNREDMTTQNKDKEDAEMADVKTEEVDFNQFLIADPTEYTEHTSIDTHIPHHDIDNQSKHEILPQSSSLPKRAEDSFTPTTSPPSSIPLVINESKLSSPSSVINTTIQSTVPLSASIPTSTSPASVITNTSYSIKESPPVIIKEELDNIDNKKTSLSTSANSTTQQLHLTAQDEWHLLQRLEHCSKKLPYRAARYKRKLGVRRLKRSLGIKLFDLDAQMIQLLRSKTPLTPINNNTIIKPASNQQVEQYPDSQQLLNKITYTPYASSFASRLYGSIRQRHTITKDESWLSSWNGRKLRPFIRRDYENKPARMLLMGQIKACHGKPIKKGQIQPSGIIRGDSIDYVYLQKEHLSQVNTLLSRSFWEGIDVSESLLFPEFSIVALYKRCVVGCAFMTPEAYITYIAVDPGWANASIGQFMLYHLFQTAISKDITLHVSANNNAMILYQKFGFKPEEFIVNFYDKYLPADSTYNWAYQLIKG